MLRAALWLVTLGQGGPVGDAGQVVRAARQAVEVDSVAAARVRFADRLRRDPTDRSAALGLAALAAYTYDYATAERGYRDLLARPGAPPDAYAVRARLGLAVALRVRGRFRDAEEPAAQAVIEARQIGDAAAEAEALLSLAAVRGRTRGRAARDSVLDAAAPLVAATPSLDASYRCARAGGAAAGTAEVLVEEGAALARRAGDRRAHAGCLFAHALILMGRGSSRLAPFRLLDEALAEYTAVGDRAAAGVVLQWKGSYQSAQGSYGVAKVNSERALLESEAAGDVNGVAWASSNLAAIALRAGDLSAAEAHLARAGERFQANGDQPGVTMTLGLQGDLARGAGDVAAARTAYRDALARNLSAGNTVGAISLHNGLADLAFIESHWDEAQRELDAARALARGSNLTGWDRGLDMWFADLALFRGDLDGAELLLVRMLESSQLAYRRYVTRARLAEVRARRGDVARAETELTAAMDTLDRWRSAQSDHDLRLAVFGIQESWADPDLGIATVLATMAGAGRADAAFALAERRRARDLLDHLLGAEAFRVEGADSAVARARPRRPAIDARAIVAALPDDETAVLEFVTGRRGEPTTLFVITRAGLTAHTLPGIDSLAAPVARFVAMIESGSDARALGKTLGGLLLAPGLRALPAAVTRLVIVPDDVLHRVPFDALALDDDRAVVERFAVSVAPSASTLAYLWGRARPPLAHPPALVFADPAFVEIAAGRADRGAGDVADAFAAAGGLPRLRYTAEEARTIARILPQATVRLRSDASEDFVKRAPLRTYRVLHFATHAVVDQRSPTRTALALAPGAGQDGFLGPGDLAALELDADLVVLSACRTASGVVVRGEGILGLTAPLLAAGARAVVATGWRVGDRSAAGLVAAFYGALARGLALSDALREAKIAALRRGAPAQDWAAFTLIGDPLVRLLPAPQARR